MSPTGPSPRANVLVLCAGHGTRLGPLSGQLPKPMLPVGDAPQLAHVLARLAEQGFDRAVVNTHHLPGAFAALASSGVTVLFSRESELRGTGGALGFARSLLEPPVVVWNGDILARPDLRPLLERARCDGICLLARPTGAGQPGTLGLDAAGRVVRLRQERFGTEVLGADYVGILALGAELLARAPERGCLVADVCLPWLRSGRVIPTLAYDGPWADIGSLASYHRVNLDWLEQRGLHAHVAADAQVDDRVELRHSLVHARARVVGQGALLRCVVFRGAQAVAPLSDAIVLENGQVVRVGDRLTIERD